MNNYHNNWGRFDTPLGKVKRFFKELFSIKTYWKLIFSTLFFTFAYASIWLLFIQIGQEGIIRHSLAQNAPQGQISGSNEALIREYVFTRVKDKLGLDEAIQAVSIIQCESQWRPDICVIEPNETISCGLWMINTVHNKKDSANYISNADKLDYKKATEWSIEKRIRDGNWSAWTCSL